MHKKNEKISLNMRIKSVPFRGKYHKYFEYQMFLTKH